LLTLAAALGVATGMFFGTALGMLLKVAQAVKVIPMAVKNRSRNINLMGSQI
jgi:hypothetical protein